MTVVKPNWSWFGVHIGFVWHGFDSRKAAGEKLLKTSPVSDKGSASWLQNQAMGEGSAITDGGSTSRNGEGPQSNTSSSSQK